MATLTTQQITPAGITPTYAGATGGGDKIVPGPTTFLHVKNTSGTSTVVTIDDALSVGPSGGSQFNPDLAVTVPITTGDKMIGPLSAERFQAVSDGLVAVTYSQVSGITVAAVRI